MVGACVDGAVCEVEHAQDLGVVACEETLGVVLHVQLGGGWGGGVGGLGEHVVEVGAWEGAVGGEEGGRHGWRDACCRGGVSWRGCGVSRGGGVDDVVRGVFEMMVCRREL